MTREGWNTTDLVREISRILGKRFDDLGYAGLKDKQAVTTQTISIYVPRETDDQELIRPDDFSVMESPEGLKFTLPRGAYAAALMWEFIKEES